MHCHCCLNTSREIEELQSLIVGSHCCRGGDTREAGGASAPPHFKAGGGGGGLTFRQYLPRHSLRTFYVCMRSAQFSLTVLLENVS